ncbi:hypothetical protein BELL_0066g00070 [Botrytis elliptica]|uniref:Nitroreductase domain-containing protein n=1 Tax=Botrytis elliptica TaxID=278938 RepID=A0A4Z1JZ36_9HELO|nr:hypothetical protein BELL_0066g00070 [Botrytis elliptica]
MRLYVRASAISTVPRLSAAIPPIAERSAPHSDPPHYKVYNGYVSGSSIMESLEILTILWSREGRSLVLFFDDRKVVSGMQSAFATYADKFPIWASQSDAMTQYAIWVALQAEGLGANLQHYSPLIDSKVASEWNIPADWELNAQLVFGTPVAEAGEKTFKPIEDRFKVYGA